MRFAICNETYEGWDFGATCADIAESGYDGVEIAPFTLADDPTEISESRAQEIGDVAKSSGLAVTGFHWLLQKPEGLHLTCPDIEIRERTKEILQHLAPHLRRYGGRGHGLRQPQTTERVARGNVRCRIWKGSGTVSRGVRCCASLGGDPGIGAPFRRVYEFHDKRRGDCASY